ncbi:hypothetical protein [Streptomyces sp. MMBL 11-3]|uniref:hypothetical protein n=1 Tax=Streptomyces sp. MMBL 11-3 TaxID=3382639 RepID=UPI0039B69CD3
MHEHGSAARPRSSAPVDAAGAVCFVRTTRAVRTARLVRTERLDRAVSASRTVRVVRIRQ